MGLDEVIASLDANASAIAKISYQMSKAMESLWAEVRHVDMYDRAATSAL
ncbi:hypothetical protein Plhal304r1_c004g0014471 [Plasmopara halstedii]